MRETWFDPNDENDNDEGEKPRAVYLDRPITAIVAYDRWKGRGVTTGDARAPYAKLSGRVLRGPDDGARFTDRLFLHRGDFKRLRARFKALGFTAKIDLGDDQSLRGALLFRPFVARFVTEIGGDRKTYARVSFASSLEEAFAKDPKKLEEVLAWCGEWREREIAEAEERRRAWRDGASSGHEDAPPDDDDGGSFYDDDEIPF